MNNIYIPSYNRADLVRTYEYLGCGKIVVPKSQEKDYKKKYGDAVVSIPDKKDGNIAKKRNAIIDLIRQREDIENFNKKAIYILIREMTDVETTHITSVVNTLKKHYKKLLNKYYNNGSILFNSSSSFF